MKFTVTIITKQDIQHIFNNLSTGRGRWLPLPEPGSGKRLFLLNGSFPLSPSAYSTVVV